MVKIRIKHLILSLLVFVLLTSVAHASVSNLQISNVDVKMISKTLRNLSNGNSISEQIRPGGQVEFRVQSSNTFSNLQDITIRDITTKVTVEGIDNGNDLEQESDSFDLRANTDRKVIFKFDIPLEVLQDTFNILIETEGQDDKNTIQRAEMKLKLEVVKDNHLLKIIQKKLTPDTVSCSRNNVQFSTTILNIGNDDEERVSILISNTDLGININDQVGGIRARPNQPESLFSKTYPFKVPVNAEAGSYPIDIRVSYDLDRKITEETATLTVNKCTTAGSNVGQTTTPATKGTQENTGVELITPTEGKTNPNAQPTTPSGTIVTQEGFLSSNAFVVGLIVAEVAIVIIGVVLVVGLFRRKR